jgi:hypothetical protein
VPPGHMPPASRFAARVARFQAALHRSMIEVIAI